MAGIGASRYIVDAVVNFESNGGAEMRTLAAAVETASNAVNAQVRAIQAQVAATQELAASLRDVTAAVTGVDAAMAGSATAAGRAAAAYDAAATSLARWNAEAGMRGPTFTTRGFMPGALGAAAFARPVPYFDPRAMGVAGFNDYRAPVTRGPLMQELDITGMPLGGYRRFTGEPNAEYWAAQRAMAAGGGGGGGIFGALAAAGGALPGLPGMIGRGVGAVTGAAFSLPGIAAEVSVGDAVNQAMKLQSIMTSVQNITNTTDDEMEKTRAKAFEVGATYGMTAVQSMGMFREIARQMQGVPGMNPERMRSVFDTLGKAQLVLRQQRGYRPEQTTDTMMSLAHIMGVYSAEGLVGTADKPGMIDYASRALELAPMTPDQFLRQTTYFGGLLRGLNVPPAEIFAMVTAMGRLGFATGRGVTGLRQVINAGLGAPAITSFATAYHMNYLRQMKMLDERGEPTWVVNGRADPIRMMGTLAQFELDALKPRSQGGKGMSVGDVQRLFTATFGQAGGNIAQILARPAQAGEPSIMQMIAGTEGAITDPRSRLGLNQQVIEFMGIPMTQMTRAWANLQSLMTEIGWIALPTLGVAFKGLADTFHDAQAWLNAHRVETKMWSDDIVVLMNDLGRFFSVLKALGPAFSVVATAILGVMRVIGDLATLNFSDMGSMVKSFRELNERTRIGQLPTHAARMAGYQAYAEQFGTEGLPKSVLAELNRLPKAGIAAAADAWASATGGGGDRDRLSTIVRGTTSGGLTQALVQMPDAHVDNSVHVTTTIHAPGVDKDNVKHIGEVVKRAVTNALHQQKVSGQSHSSGTLPKALTVGGW